MRAKAVGLLKVDIQETGKHSKIVIGKRKIPFPRQREIDEDLARFIMKQLENELGKGWWKND